MVAAASTNTLNAVCCCVLLVRECMHDMDIRDSVFCGLLALFLSVKCQTEQWTHTWGKTVALRLWHFCDSTKHRTGSTM